MDLLSAFYRFDVDGVDAISMDSVHIPVMVQLQIQDPERDKIENTYEYMFWVFFRFPPVTSQDAEILF